jgi:hypothetical protein
MRTLVGGRPRALVAIPVLLAIAGLGAFLVLGALGGSGQARADSPHTHTRHTGSLPGEVALRQDMRALWEEHIIWTRMVIVDFAAGAPSLTESQSRLLENQTDIGDAVAPFYGKAAGKRLTSLLRDHILIAGDVLTAAKAGEAAGLAEAQVRWSQNGAQIADYLSSANPTAWPRPEMRRMMRDHLTLTTEEAVARLSGNWSADVRAFDKVHAQALGMADMLSSGIISQFPRRFR